MNTKQITLTTIAGAACAALCMGSLTQSTAAPAAHRHAVRDHKMVTVNSLGVTPLQVITDNGAIALAPKGWSMSANDRGSVDMHSPDGASYAGWGGVSINRQMEPYYGEMYGAPEESIKAIMSGALKSTGEASDVEYTSGPRQVGYFSERDWQTSAKHGKVFYHIYGDPNTQYVESLYICYTDRTRWHKLAPMLINVALSIEGHVVLHRAPGGGYHYTPSDDNGGGDGGDDNPLKDYNAQLGTQWFHDDLGNNYNVDPNDCTVDGPDGEGVYKINGNDVYKLKPGIS